MAHKTVCQFFSPVQSQNSMPLPQKLYKSLPMFKKKKKKVESCFLSSSCCRF